MAEMKKETTFVLSNDNAALEFPPLIDGRRTIPEICVSDSHGNFLIIRGPFFEVRRGKEAEATGQK